MAIPKMLEDIITEDEKEFWKQYDSAYLEKMIPLNDISLSFHRVGHLREMVKKIIKSNKELAQSNDKHSKAMIVLTAALVFAGLAQLVMAIIG